MLRLLLYSHSFAPSVGGVETYAGLLAEGLAESMAVTVVTQTPNDESNDDACYRLLRRPNILRLARQVIESDVVLLAGPSLSAMMLSTILRRPFAVEHHGYQSICLNGLLLNKAQGLSICEGHFQKRRYWKCIACGSRDQGAVLAIRQLALTCLRNWISRRASVNIGVSDHVCRRHSLPRMETIYHGIADNHATECSGSRGRVHFAFVGRLVEEKGINLLLDAAIALKRAGYVFRLSIIGDGPLREFLQTRCTELGADATVTGFLRKDELHCALNTVDVVVMPSICEETAGLSAIEQMMRGRVVLAANIGGLGEIVGVGGVLFKAYDVQDLREKMQMLLDVRTRVDIGMAARRWALERFQLNRMVKEHQSLLERIAGFQP